MRLPAGIPPIVHRRDFWEPYIARQWKDAEAKWDTKLEFCRDVRNWNRMDRPDSPNLGAYDPNRSNSLAMYGILATRNNRVVMTYAGAVFSLGDMDFRQYVETIGLYDGDDGEFRFEPGSPAFMLATGLRSQAAFMGNVWVPPDMRGKESGHRPWVHSLVMRLGMLARAINHGAFNCDNTVYFSKDVHVQAGYTGVTEQRAPGVIFKGGEAVWLGYSGPLFAEDLARGHAA